MKTVREELSSRLFHEGFSENKINSVMGKLPEVAPTLSSILDQEWDSYSVMVQEFSWAITRTIAEDCE